MFNRLWADDSGAILSLEIILIATILGIGILAGLTALRDAIITELADVGGSISTLDQSYVIHGATAHSAATSGTFFTDLHDFGDVNGDPVVVNERCLVICAGLNVVPPVGNEGVPVVTP